MWKTWFFYLEEFVLFNKNVTHKWINNGSQRVWGRIVSVCVCLCADCTICSDFSALSLMSLIFPKSCWMAIWASSRACPKIGKTPRDILVKRHITLKRGMSWVDGHNLTGFIRSVHACYLFHCFRVSLPNTEKDRLRLVQIILSLLRFCTNIGITWVLMDESLWLFEASTWDATQMCFLVGSASKKMSFIHKFVGRENGKSVISWLISYSAFNQNVRHPLLHPKCKISTWFQNSLEKLCYHPHFL